MYYDCEMVKYNLCLGCTGLAESDWQGKYKCKYYQQLKQSEEYRNLIRKRGNKNVYSRANYRSGIGNNTSSNITNE